MATTTPVAPQYPFDPTGTAATNLIQNERQVLKPPATNGNWSDYFFIIPTAAPYFADSLQMTLSSGKQLVEGVDYICTHRFYDATIQSASPVYGSISFMDKTLDGIVTYSYQTVGGDWTVNSVQIAQVLANTALDPRTTTWEEVVDLPYQFPPVKHAWDIVDMTGASDVVAALNNIVTALQNSGDQGLARHLADYGNPHHVTAAQVGLGSVSNYPMAASADAVTGASTQLYMSPATTMAAIAAQALTPLNAHVNSQSNPHNTTKAQVGLSNVPNLGLASTVDAQSGTINTALMTPALTAAAIAAQSTAPLNAHIANTNNPHGTTKAQVGLGDAPNYPPATLNEALAGTANDRLMTPALVAAVMNGNLGGSLQAHIADHGNPHQVTATQVGLGNVPNYAMATNAQALAGTSQVLFMSPALVMAVVQDQNLNFVTHINNTSNPHNTTAEQVGLGLVQNYGFATTANATTGNGTDGYMNAALTKNAIDAQIGTDARAHMQSQANPHNTTAEQVGAYDKAAVDALIATLTNGKLDTTATAADSSKLAGQTLQQVINSIQLALPGAARFFYPAINPGEDAEDNPIYTGVTWTALADVVAFTPNVDVPLPAIGFIYAGGEARDDRDVPVYLISIDPRNVTNYRCEQLSGRPEQLSFGYQYNASTNAFTLYVKSPFKRNGITITPFSDPGNAYASVTTVFDTEPTDITYLSVDDRTIQDTSMLGLAGQQRFGSAVGYTEFNHPSVVSDTLLQNVNVLDSGEDPTNAQAAQMSWAGSTPHFVRLAAFGNEPARAKALTGWVYDTSVNAVIAKNSSNSALYQLVSNQTIWGDYQFEVLVDSTDAADYAVGLVAGFTDRDGQPKAIYALRDCGALTTDAQKPGGILGDAFYKLFSVGYNLFQDDALDLGSNSSGLTWGDGVLDSNRANTPYVPNATTAGANGWSGKGKVAIRVTVARTGGTGGLPLMTLETSDFGATTGSITYVAAAKVTIDFGVANLPAELMALRSAIALEGVRWGFAAYRQAPARFVPTAHPDKYLRYIACSTDANGIDTSTLNAYNGTAWVSKALTDTVYNKPNRMYVSNLNQRLYQSANDGSLQPIYVLGYNGTGREILTT